MLDWSEQDQARCQQSLLSETTEFGKDYLAAVTINLRIAERHRLAQSLTPSSLDDVLFDRLDRDSALPEPFQCAFDLIGGTFELHRHQAHFIGDACAADIEHQIKLLHQMIKDRFLYQHAWIAQVVAFADFFCAGGHGFQSCCHDSLVPLRS